jgi:hypothetical protein
MYCRLCNEIFIVVLVWINVCWGMTSGHFKPLTTKLTRFFEMLTASYLIPHHVPEDWNPLLHHCENLKSLV